MTDLAVVIVSWNVRALVLQTLESLLADLKTSGLETQVIVLDNASTDGTVEAVRSAFPQVTVIASEENLGFVRGNNHALRSLGFGAGKPLESLPRAVYLLNPDTITQLGATRALYEALLADPRRGLVGARLSFGDGSFQHSAFTFPGLRQLWVELFPTPGRLIEHPFNGRYPRALYQGTNPFPVDFVLGATMMLPREVVEQVGMFDEAYFMYCEEVDWAWRIREAGWGVLCVPAAHVVHLGGQSTGQIRPQTLVHLWTSRLRLYRKTQPRWKYQLAKWMVALGMRRQMAQAKTLPEDQQRALLPAYEQLYQLARSS